MNPNFDIFESSFTCLKCGEPLDGLHCNGFLLWCQNGHVYAFADGKDHSEPDATLIV